ncbi:MAG: FAD-dependent monooxygenase [Bacteroidetes bacterium]|nr:FAD-dependent monooxygenase [Bacteroidota bacterium]
MSKHITIVGAGLVGSLLACYLSKRGHRVSVFERRSDMRVAGYVGGRSINLALSHRGWKALKKIGLDKEVEPITIPMKGRVIHDLKGNTSFFPYGTDDQAIYSVSRGDLNKIMVEKADSFPQVDFHFEQRCAHIDFSANRVVFENTATKQQQTLESDLIFGADGAYSQVRYQMQLTPDFNIHQQHEPYGYKELHIPPGPAGEHLIEKNALHIWPRGNFMMIALPNMDGSFTVTLFNSFSGENSFAQLNDEKSVNDFFQNFFPDAVSLMPNISKHFFENPTSSLVTIRCYPWHHKNTCLIGDAAHAIVPFYGQGMNCGFEDVNELDDLMNALGEDWNAVLDTFQKQRKPNGDAILDLALHNYIEMRDLSGREDFQLRTKIEKKIAESFPDKFMTHYSMVTFSDLSYAEAKHRGEKQNELLDELMRLNDIATIWESALVLQKAEKWINENLS